MIYNNHNNYIALLIYSYLALYLTVLKADIVLPPRLFEDIQLKGIELDWPIPIKFLKPCLAFRDALNWVNVDLLQYYCEVNELLKVQESNLPLKQFSFRICTLTPELIRLIRRFSATFEILQIDSFHLPLINYQFESVIRLVTLSAADISSKCKKNRCNYFLFM